MNLEAGWGKGQTGPAPASAKARRLNWQFQFSLEKGCHRGVVSVGRVGWPRTQARPVQAGVLSIWKDQARPSEKGAQLWDSPGTEVLPESFRRPRARRALRQEPMVLLWPHRSAQQGKAPGDADRARSTSGVCPTPPGLHPHAPQVAGGQGGAPMHPSPPLRSRPRSLRAPARVGRSAAGEGVETRSRGERTARSGEGASGSAGSAPHSRRKGREAVAGAPRARRGGERAGGGGPGAGWHPAGRSGLAANAVTCAARPLAPASPARRALHS